MNFHTIPEISERVEQIGAPARAYQLDPVKYLENKIRCDFDRRVPPWEEELHLISIVGLAHEYLLKEMVTREFFDELKRDME